MELGIICKSERLVVPNGIATLESSAPPLAPNSQGTAADSAIYISGKFSLYLAAASVRSVMLPGEPTMFSNQ